MSIISALGEITLEVGVKKGRQEREAEILALIEAHQDRILNYAKGEPVKVQKLAIIKHELLEEIKARIQETK